MTASQHTHHLAGWQAVGDWRPERIENGLAEQSADDHWLASAAFALPLNADGSYRFGSERRDVLWSKWDV
jgi:hypothetical protein